MRMKSHFPTTGAAALLLIVSAACAAAQTLVSVSVTQIYEHNGSTSMSVGALRQFTATGNYSDGSQRYVTQQVNWRSANVGIAKVTKMGLVTAVAPGAVNINATLGAVTGSNSLTVRGTLVHLGDL